MHKNSFFNLAKHQLFLWFQPTHFTLSNVVGDRELKIFPNIKWRNSFRQLLQQNCWFGKLISLFCAWRRHAGKKHFSHDETTGRTLAQNHSRNQRTTNALCATPLQGSQHKRTFDRFTREGGGGTPYNGLYGEAPPERGTFFRLQV